MSAVLLRLIVVGVIGLMIFFGARRIWRDWTSQFKSLDEEDKARRRARDLRERQRPDVIDLKRSDDGTYRPEDRNKNQEDDRR
ncbi:hypothetical protein GCM10007989_27650 [Devosia pacifica]|uniref:Uncharacterized protein n=1 Tax=Devosia pacifica TaxID=1335967 RepID=A0A918SBF5_9HYPH|nr:hypothetical protein [Devosia pacifica]GHA30370.1 hypothetical protein GCM10007989_27650 [Devosia pacifica]